MNAQIRNREEAGRLLGQRLVAYKGRPDVIVLGLPRGGVAVAHEIAEALEVPLDVFLVRKLGVPGFEELAMGAIAMGGSELVDPDVVEEFDLSGSVIRRVAATERRSWNVASMSIVVRVRHSMCTIRQSFSSMTELPPAQRFVSLSKL